MLGGWVLSESTTLFYQPLHLASHKKSCIFWLLSLYIVLMLIKPACLSLVSTKSRNRIRPFVHKLWCILALALWRPVTLFFYLLYCNVVISIMQLQIDLLSTASADGHRFLVCCQLPSCMYIVAPTISVMLVRLFCWLIKYSSTEVLKMSLTGSLEVSA